MNKYTHIRITKNCRDKLKTLADVNKVSMLTQIEQLIDNVNTDVNTNVNTNVNTECHDSIECSGCGAIDADKVTLDMVHDYKFELIHGDALKDITFPEEEKPFNTFVKENTGKIQPENMRKVYDKGIISSKLKSTGASTGASMSKQVSK